MSETSKSTNFSRTAETSPNTNVNINEQTFIKTGAPENINANYTGDSRKYCDHAIKAIETAKDKRIMAAINKAVAKYPDLNEMLNEMLNEYNRQGIVLDEALEENTVLREKYEQLRSECSRRSNQEQRLRENLASAIKKNEEAEATAKKQKSAIAALNEKNNKINEGYRALYNELAEADKEIKNLQNHISADEKLFSRYKDKARIKELENQIRDLKARWPKLGRPRLTDDQLAIIKNMHAKRIYSDADIAAVAECSETSVAKYKHIV